MNGCFARALFVVLGFVAAPAFAADADTLVCAGAKIYPSPTDAPLVHATVIIRQGRIAAVHAGDPTAAEVPATAERLSCAGKVVVAGFWNSHVHFTNGWDDAATAAAPRLERDLQAMLTRWGFTTVWDLGSPPPSTLALRSRIASGNVRGPRILSAGDIFPEHGHPVYLPASMKLPEAATPAEAHRLAENYLALGLDGIKLFTGAFMGPRPVVNMDTAVARAAVDVAHAHGKRVFAHPQNHAGIDHALDAGVDVLAHTIPEDARFTDAELQQMKRQRTALIPTLTLFTTVASDRAVTERLVRNTVAQLTQYAAAGGTILFGTDVGFIRVFDPTEEYSLMARALSWSAILASLTTAPAAFFADARRGRVAAGLDADLVVLDADPAADVRNLANVAYTIRGGHVIFRR